MAFSRQPKLRFIPPAGPPVEYDLTTLRFISVCQPFHEAIFIEKEMLDYSIRTTKKGWRVSVRLEFQVGEGSADDALLAQVWQRLLDEDQVLEVTLDGGAVWREAVLVEWTRQPTAEKNIGTTYGVMLVCTKLLRPGLVGPGETRTAPPVMEAW